MADWARMQQRLKQPEGSVVTHGSTHALDEGRRTLCGSNGTGVRDYARVTCRECTSMNTYGAVAVLHRISHRLPAHG